MVNDEPDNRFGVFFLKKKGFSESAGHGSLTCSSFPWVSQREWMLQLSSCS